jgi:hypothetical protein
MILLRLSLASQHRISWSIPEILNPDTTKLMRFSCVEVVPETKYHQIHERETPNTAILKLDDTGVPSDAKEAVSFAQQALEAILGRAALVPISSDTLTPNTICGKISPGLRWREVMMQATNFGRGSNCRR